MTTTLALLLTLTAHAGPVPMCSAELEYLDGTERTAVMECENENAGKCLKQVELRNGKVIWKEVVCK